MLGELSRPPRGEHDHGRARRVARFGLLVLLASQPAAASSREDCAISGACCFPRSAPRTLKLPGPRLANLASISVAEGGLGRPVVKRVLANRTAALGACAVGSGTARAHLVIAPSGIAHVERATGEAASCVTEVLRATVFPASSVVTAVDLTLTW